MQMILHVHQSFQGALLWGWLKRFSAQFHFIHGLVTAGLGYNENASDPFPAQRAQYLSRGSIA